MDRYLDVKSNILNELNNSNEISEIQLENNNSN